MTSNGWNKVILDEVSYYGNEKVPSTEVTLDNYISTENMLPNKSGVETASKLPTTKNVSRYEKGDILLSNIRPYFKKIWLASKYGGCSNDVLVIKNKDNNILDKTYLYYTLLQDNFFDYVTATSKGTKMPRGDKTAIMNYGIFLPPLIEQKVIANILSTLDDKIETNNQIIERLEEMAQALFKHWFVNFEFPNENGEPYKSSGGEMVESELGLIPKGWEIVNLDELTTKFTTGLNPRKNFVLGHGNNYYVTIKNMGNQQIYLDDKCDKIDDDALKVINKRSDLKKGDLLFSGIGTIGRVYLIDETPTSWNISESIFTLRPSDYISSELLYLILLSEELQGYAQQLASGSVQRGVRMRDLKAYKLSLPCKCLTDKFTSLVSPLIKQQKNLVKENVRLTNIRETLLPKLLSGEIRIPLNDE